MKLKCDMPPFGWRCSRDKGHEGPCAARPTVKVSDDEINRACRFYYNSGFKVYAPNFDAMRVALIDYIEQKQMRDSFEPVCPCGSSLCDGKYDET